MSQHTVKAFDQDIDEIRRLIAEMGGRAEAAVGAAVHALMKHDLDAAQSIVDDDRKIDALEAELEHLAVKVLALRAPMAVDLRETIAALKIAGTLERIGDYAKNIAKRIHSVDGGRRLEAMSLLPAMADTVVDIVHEVMNAFVARDAKKASAVWARDQEVDDFFESVFRVLVTSMMEDPKSIGSAAHLLFIAKNLERIGDHATNIAEMVCYAVTGERPGERPRGAAGAPSA